MAYTTPKRLRSVNLTTRVRLEAPSSAVDADYGTPSGAYTSVAECWAEVVDTRAGSRERLAGDAQGAEAMVLVRIRWQPSLPVNLRVVELSGPGRTLELIAPPVELGWREGLELSCKAYH